MSNDRASAAPHTHAFYGSGPGTRLIDDGNYPPAIQEYLRAEERLLASLADGFSTLVEVGCMHGRYLDWAASHGKAYLGVDPVDAYIRQGRQRLAEDSAPRGTARFARGTAERIDQVLAREGITGDARPLLFFPFNSFGQSRTPRDIAAALGRARAPFLICSYGTDERASAVRRRYYEACRFADLREVADDTGVRFQSADGLHSAAYHAAVLEGMFRAEGVAVRTMEFADVGMACLGLPSSWDGG